MRVLVEVPSSIIASSFHERERERERAFHASLGRYNARGLLDVDSMMVYCCRPC